MYFLEYSDLIKNLVISDLKTKYSNSVLGFAWSMINPLLMMVVLYVVFKNVFKQDQNLALNILIGLFVWRFFTIGTTGGMGSVVGKPSLVTKIFIPREILTLSCTLSNLISSLLEFMVLIPLLLLIGAEFSLTYALFPVLHICYFMIIYGVSLMVASLYVYFRDLNQIWDVLMQIGFFICPIVYPLSTIPLEYRSLYMLNPITILIEMYRNIFLHGKVPGLEDFCIVLMFGIGLLLIGSVMFARLSRRFAEEV